MKQLILSFIIFSGCLIFSGCIKNTPYATTPNPYMNVTIGPYIFNTSTVYPITLTEVGIDSFIRLEIVGEQLQTKEKIVLTIQHYKGTAGIFSMAAGQAEGKYYHSTGVGVSLGGIVAITKFTPDCIVGYFNFDTQDGLYLTKGTFTCPKPFYAAHP